MDGIVAQKMRVGLDRAEIIDRHDVNVGAAGFVDRPNDVAADAAEAIDCDAYLCHGSLLNLNRLVSGYAAS